MGLQYLFYLARIGLALSPCSNNQLFLSLGPRQQYERVFKKCRYWFARLPFLKMDAKQDGDEIPDCHMLRKANQNFGLCNGHEKHRVTQMLLNVKSCVVCGHCLLDYTRT